MKTNKHNNLSFSRASRLNSARRAILEAWRNCFNYPQSTIRDRINHFLWLKNKPLIPGDK